MRKQLTVFLSGGMTGLTEEEANKWRKVFTNKILYKLFDSIFDCPYKFINPVTKYFTTEPTTPEFEKEAMQYDLYWIKQSDVIIVNFNSLQSIGTAQELMYAHTLNKPIIGMIPANKYNDLHPWYKEECMKIFQYEDTDEGLDDVIENIYFYLTRFV